MKRILCTVDRTRDLLNVICNGSSWPRMVTRSIGPNKTIGCVCVGGGGLRACMRSFVCLSICVCVCVRERERERERGEREGEKERERERERETFLLLSHCEFSWIV